MGGDQASSGVKLPEAPVIAAGALGGPIITYLVTPPRNAMSIAAQDVSLGFSPVFRSVFANGLTGAYKGGMYPAIAACPQFLCLGPMYHFFASFAGTAGGMVLTAATETAICYGAETRNGQIAINQAVPGRVPAARLQSSFIGWGPGCMINFTRNVFAMSGMRLINKPIDDAISKVAGGKSGLVTLVSDLTANCCAAGITMPMHMLYQFVITSGPDLWDKPQAEQNNRMVSFLKGSYFPGGRLSSTIVRDLMLRVSYNATANTLYVQLERAAIKYWPQ